MRFNIENIPEEVRQVGPRPGDVFPTKGGRGKAKMWLALEVADSKMHMVGLDRTSSDGAMV